MVFRFVQNIFFGQHKSYNIYFLCRAKREIFFNNLTLAYMTKTLNQIIFFFLQQNQNISFSNIGNQNIFLEKNHNPLLEVKWSVPKVFNNENNSYHKMSVKLPPAFSWMVLFTSVYKCYIWTALSFCYQNLWKICNGNCSVRIFIFLYQMFFSKKRFDRK